jgi:hypothetical protein
MRTFFNLLNSWNTFKKVPNSGITMATIPHILPGSLEQGHATIVNTLQGALGFTHLPRIRSGPKVKENGRSASALEPVLWATIGWGCK